MRDAVLITHILIGLALVVIPLKIVLELDQESRLLKILSVMAAALSWFLFIPAGILYITYYPATKAIIKAGGTPWVHSVIMETKEHIAFVIPIVATVAMGLIFLGKRRQSKKWWILLMILSGLIGVMGLIISRSAL